MPTQLESWNDGAAKRAIVDFVTHVTTANGPDFVPPADRIATFDNDGTLWCEKPLPIQLDFILRRWAEMAKRIPRCANNSRGNPPSKKIMPGWAA